jgi:hypothetical protein
LETFESFTWTVVGQTSIALKSTFKHAILVAFNGAKLNVIQEDEIVLTSTNTVYSGTPTGYYLNENVMWFDRKATEGRLKVSYHATLSPDGGDPPDQHATDLTIPEKYGNDLCNYAVAIASAKLNPGMHDKHWMLWKTSIDEIINQDADRELIHTIKREV